MLADSHQVRRVRHHDVKHAMQLRRDRARLAVIVLREAAQRLEARVVLQQLRAQARHGSAQRPEQRRAGHAGDGAAGARRARNCSRDGPRCVLAVPELALAKNSVTVAPLRTPAQELQERQRCRPTGALPRLVEPLHFYYASI